MVRLGSLRLALPLDDLAVIEDDGAAVLQAGSVIVLRILGAVDPKTAADEAVGRHTPRSLLILEI